MPVPFGLPAELAELQDDYDIRGELGRGGAAVVYRAVDRALGRDVAIKVVHPRPTSPDDDPVARLAREARMVAQLQHPNIVAVYAVRRLRGGGLALIMQLVDGGTLKTAVQDGGPLPPDRAELLLRDVASALAYAHARGVIHRDVKPENIFLDEQSGMALLADFGIARSTASDSMTMTGIAVGTPFYMSPEQVDGGAVDGRSDLYSLGLATWEALTGHRPWDGETLYNVMHRQKFDELPPIEALRTGVPRRLQYVVERMLQKRPGARWAGAEGLLSQLDHPVLPADFTRWQKALPARVERYRAAEAARAAERAAVAAELSEPLASASTLHFSPGGLPARGVPGLLVAPPAGADAARPWVPGPAGETIGGSGGPRASAGRVTRAGDLDALLPEPGMTVDLHDTAAALVHDTPEETDTPTAVRYPDVIEPSWGRSPSAVWRAARSPRAALVAAAALGLIGTGGVLTFDRLGPGRAGMGYAVRALGLGSATAPIARSASGRGDAATARTSGATATPDAHLADEAPTTMAAGAPAGLSLTVASGGRHSCALTLAGRAHCWGANDRGQLGDGGPAVTHATPVPVTGVLSFGALAAGSAHTCAVTRLGDIYCWGANTRGQLGDATTVRRNAPVRVAGPGAYASVAAGSAHSCAVTADAAVRCWGANDHGQLGDGTTESRSVPATVRLDGPVRQVAVGGQHTCAVTTDGRLACWGANGNGQLGTGRTGAGTPLPQPIRLPGRVLQVALGLAHTCALDDGGALWCWGGNDAGQLGDGTRAARTTPVRAALGPARVAGVTTGAAHSCAILAEGALTCWGRNSRGAVGDGTVVSRTVPARVPLRAPVGAASAGTGHTCAVTLTGETLCWGDNLDGQLGDRNRLSRPTPVPVRYPPGVQARLILGTVATR